MKTTPISIWSAEPLLATGSVIGKAYPLAQAFGYALQVAWTGTPTGNFTLQGSCDVGTSYPDGTTSGITNWTTIANTSTAASGAAGTLLYNMADTMYLWVRVVYTASSGTGAATARMSVKGV